jgi:prephenate dehydratase
MIRIGYLGPKGTFSETAVCGYLIRHGISLSDVEMVAVDSIATLLQLYHSDPLCERIVVPVENSIEGPVLITQDMLPTMGQIYIQEEFSLAIVNHLLVLPGTDWRLVTDVVSHPQPIGQCQGFLRNSFHTPPSLHFSDSTAGAARSVAEKKILRSGADPALAAAIGSDRLAEIYGLEIAQSGIQDTDTNRTRFWVLSRTPSRPSDYDKTSIVFSCRQDQSGGLVTILSEFSSRSLNLTSISSRPTKLVLGEYLFFVDFIGHSDDPVVESALQCIKEQASFFKLIGSYRVVTEV